jgi:hypothetical protein
VSLEGAQIDVSGDAGGGTALIGGDYHGEGTTPTANRTFIDASTTITADAGSLGDGGKVIVWSDDLTISHGSIRARGGAQGGDGGFVEISSANNLVADGPVHLSAPHGLAGTLLYDPLEIELRGGTADGGDAGDFREDQLLQRGELPGQIRYGEEASPPSPTQPFVIYQSEIENTDANIVLQARRSIFTSGTFDNSQLVLPADRNLILQTRNSVNDLDPGSAQAPGINLASSASGSSLVIRARGTGSINLESGTDGGSAADIMTCRMTTESGAVSLTAHSGTIRLAGDVTAGGDVNLNSTVSLQNSVNLSSLQGNVRFSGGVSSGAIPLDLSVSAGHLIVLNGNLGSAANPLGQLVLNGGGTAANSALATIVRDSPGDLAIDAQVFTMGQNQKLVVADGNLDIRAGQRASLGDLGASGDISVHSPAIALVDRQPSPGLAGDIGLDFAAQSISFVDANNMPLSLGGQITFAGTGNGRASFATAGGAARVNGFDIFQFRLTPSGLIRRDSSGSILDPIAVPTATAESAETINMGYGSIQFPQVSADPELPLEDLADPESGSVVVEDISPLALKEELAKIKVFVRDPTGQELDRSLLGRALYEQVVKREVQKQQKVAQIIPEDFQVVIRRVSKHSLAHTVQTIGELLPAGMGPEQHAERVDEIKGAIQDAYAAYEDATKATGPEGFRDYLERASARGDAGADKTLAYLNLLRQLLSQVRALGLTETEVTISRSAIIGIIRPAQMDPVTLESLVREIAKPSVAPLRPPEPQR